MFRIYIFIDVYNKEFSEVLVQGDIGYKTAKKHMKMLLPSHAKRVQQYKNEIPLFTKHKIDEQLDSIMIQKVDLESGGHLVIDTTEALVAIDVNSGKSTRERNIEETALKTNLEAALETARQLRLRDLAGLIVIDFIDMESYKNNRSVEKKLKEELKADRARIQVGRISSFGLLEMSRQRLRPSIIETSTNKCDLCGGSGLVRSTESAALHVLRGIESEANNNKKSRLIKVETVSEVALYILNQKRFSIQQIEQNHSITIEINSNNQLTSPEYKIETFSAELVSQSVFNPDNQGNSSNNSEKLDDDPNARKKNRNRRRRPFKKKKKDYEAEASQTDPNSNQEGNNEKIEDSEINKTANKDKSVRKTKQNKQITKSKKPVKKNNKSSKTIKNNSLPKDTVKKFE